MRNRRLATHTALIDGKVLAMTCSRIISKAIGGYRFWPTSAEQLSLQVTKKAFLLLTLDKTCAKRNAKQSIRHDKCRFS